MLLNWKFDFICLKFYLLIIRFVNRKSCGSFWLKLRWYESGCPLARSYQTFFCLFLDSKQVIVGLSVGIVVFLIFLLLACCWIYKRRSKYMSLLLPFIRLILFFSFRISWSGVCQNLKQMAFLQIVSMSHELWPWNPWFSVSTTEVKRIYLGIKCLQFYFRKTFSASATKSTRYNLFYCDALELFNT